MHPYTTEFLAHDHIATLRAEAERDRLGLQDRPRRPARRGVSRLLAHVLAVGNHHRASHVLTVQPTD